MMRAVAAVALAVASGIGGGMVAANVVGPSSVDACYSNSTGALRVDTDCRRNETAIVLGTVGFQTRQVSVHGTVDGGQYEVIEASCGPGEVVTGGGVTVWGISYEYAVWVNEPVNDGSQGWRGGVTWPFGDPEDYVEFDVFAVCALGTPAE